MAVERGFLLGKFAEYAQFKTVMNPDRVFGIVRSIVENV